MSFFKLRGESKASEKTFRGRILSLSKPIVSKVFLRRKEAPFSRILLKKFTSSFWKIEACGFLLIRLSIPFKRNSLKSAGGGILPIRSGNGEEFLKHALISSSFFRSPCLIICQETRKRMQKKIKGTCLTLNLQKSAGMSPISPSL